MVTVETFEKAILYSVKKHRGQRRKGDGRPYILHPISVMTHVRNSKDSKNIYLIASAAMLHDTVEDCGVSMKKITKKFGLYVAALVNELTTDKAKCEKMGKTDYLCQHMFAMSSYALVIKLCDRLDNVSDLDTMSPEFKDRYTKETIAILEYISTRKLTDTHKKIIALIWKALRIER